MKLAGPRGLGWRIAAGRDHSRAIVTGVFPPERAPAFRESAQSVVDAAQPRIREVLDEVAADLHHRMLYGEPGDNAPCGILRGTSYLSTLTEALPRV